MFENGGAMTMESKVMEARWGMIHGAVALVSDALRHFTIMALFLCTSYAVVCTIFSPFCTNDLKVKFGNCLH